MTKKQLRRAIIKYQNQTGVNKHVAKAAVEKMNGQSEEPKN